MAYSSNVEIKIKFNKCYGFVVKEINEDLKCSVHRKLHLRSGQPGIGQNLTITFMVFLNLSRIRISSSIILFLFIVSQQYLPYNATSGCDLICHPCKAVNSTACYKSKTFKNTIACTKRKKNQDKIFIKFLVQKGWLA
jgi:hypothetical protein